MSELSSSSPSGASDYDKISGIEPLPQSSASGSLQSSSQLKANATEKYLTTGRLSENKDEKGATVPVALNQPQEKKVKAYFTKNSTVIQYTSSGGTEAVPIVKASMASVNNPPASWTVESAQSTNQTSVTQGPARPKGARVKLFQEGSETANTSVSESVTSTTMDASQDHSGHEENTSRQHGDTEVVIIPSNLNGDDNQSLSSIDQAINMALELANTDHESEDGGDEPGDVSQQEISQNSFTSSSRNDSAMDESIDRQVHGYNISHVI